MADKEAPPRPTASGADRLSALPDGVREHVLSFLPAHEAVRTTVLARSWRDLWRRSPALRITVWGTVDKFNRFMERLLRLHLSSPDSGPHGAPAPLDSCHIEFDTLEFEDDEDTIAGADEAPVADWIESALRCRVQELRFFFEREGDNMDTLPLLPDLSLTPSRHLTRFALDGVEFNYGFNLSGFPALKYLDMHDCFFWTDEIRSPSLKRLTMDSCGFYPPGRRVPIYLPSLVSLKMIECHTRTPVFANMPSLETAIVRVESDNCGDTCSLASVDGCGREQCAGCQDYYDSHVDRTSCLLLGTLSEATNLELSAYPQVVVFIRDLKFANSFDKLKTLVLADWFVVADLSALIWFLHHSPILQKLTLEISKVHKCTMNTKGSCKLPELPVTSSHLKLVEIKCPEVDGTVFEILKILTSSGVPLEQINVQCSITSGFVNFKCTGFSAE